MRGGAGTLWLAEDGLWLTLVGQCQPGPCKAVNLKFSFVGANPYPRLEPFDRQSIVVHYYRGSDPAQWHTDVPIWGGVRYRDLYPGVDLVVGTDLAPASGQPRGMSLPWRLEVRADAGLSTVRLQVEGAEDVTTTADHLRLSTSLGQISIPLLVGAFDTPASAPTAARTGHERFEIVAPYTAADSDDLVAPQMSYPEEAYFGSYLGGSDNDWVYDIAVAGQGDILNRDYEFSGGESRSIWVVGWTTSNDFPTAPGTTSLSGASDAFVTRMKRTATLVAPVYSAYIGGTDEDAARGIAVDANGNAYVTGWTKSNDFATTTNAFDRTHNGDVDAFLLRISGTGTLLYGSYLGATSVDDGVAIAVDAQGAAYLTGYTNSSGFPTTAGAYSRAPAGNDDLFIAKFSPAGQGQSDLLYSTFVGGYSTDRASNLAVDAAGVVYVTGFTGDLFAPSGENDFPTTLGAFGTQAQGNDIEAFVLKLNPAGNGSADLLYSTFLGTEGKTDSGEGIAVDSAGRVYVSGVTWSPDFPTTAGAFDTTCGNDGNCDWRTDYFVSELNPAGNGSADLLYSTFLGGELWEGFVGESDLALGSDGDVYVSGDTSSTAGFPITADAYDQTGDSSAGDAFVVRLRLQGLGSDDLVYGTYVGGSSRESAPAIALDESDRVYVAGETLSPDFPTTAHAAYKYSYGQDDVYLFRLVAPPAPDLSPSTKTVAPAEAAAGQVVTFTVQLANSGLVSTTAVFTDTLPAALLLRGSPVASSGPAPSVNGQAVTWAGMVSAGETVVITYATQLTSTTALTPIAVNYALISDGRGNVYTRRAYVNGHYLFLPLVLRNG